MHKYEATVAWQRGDQSFADNRYSRAHEWRFDGGARVPASPSPQSVPVPLSDPAGVDPEEALVAAASSCHMLFFLAYAAKRGFTVDSYVDDAFGVMERNADNKFAITRITLRPKVVFGGERQPSAEQIAALHHDSHEQCYVANSLKSEIVIEPA
ncbi:MAG TPA: OsmC family protein [Paucimonas sp.]|nr:OsmC family protein [Paucimonas sp.]